jgi:hypothetical protein
MHTGLQCGVVRHTLPRLGHAAIRLHLLDQSHQVPPFAGAITTGSIRLYAGLLLFTPGTDDMYPAASLDCPPSAFESSDSFSTLRQVSTTSSPNSASQLSSPVGQSDFQFVTHHVFATVNTHCIHFFLFILFWHSRTSRCSSHHQSPPWLHLRRSRSAKLERTRTMYCCAVVERRGYNWVCSTHRGARARTHTRSTVLL